GYDAWRVRFGGDPDIVGRSLRVNGEAAEVVGVMPEGFQFPFLQQVWVPHRVDPAPLDRRAGTPLEVVGYLRPGVSFEAARAEVESVGGRLAAEHPESDGIRPVLRGFLEASTPPQIVMMMGLLAAMVL